MLPSPLSGAQASQDADPLGRGIPSVRAEGFKLLGAPIGSSAFEGEYLDEKVDKLDQLMDKISRLEDPHTEYALLRNCFALPKLSYLMRAVDPRHHQGSLVRFDTFVRKALEETLRVPLLDHQWMQATLPVSAGGLGLRSAERHAACAYTASLAASADIMEEIRGKASDMEEMVHWHAGLIRGLAGEEDEEELTPAVVLASSQKILSHRVDQHYSKLLNDRVVDERGKARLNSLTVRRAGDWLNTIPVKALGLHLRPREFTVAVKYRLGVRVYTESGPCTACGEDSDVYGDHAVGCGSEGERIFRHNILRDAIHQTAKQASLAPAKEQSALLPGSQAKPADVFIPRWANGADCALDVTVVSSLQKELVRRAAAEVGSAAAKRYSDKMTKYFQACAGEGIKFCPVVVEALGGWQEDAAYVITRLARQLASHTGKEAAEQVKYFFQRLGILLMRGNSALILNRTPTHVEAEVDGDQDFDA